MIPQAKEIVDLRDNIVNCTIHGKQYGYHICRHLYDGAEVSIHEEPGPKSMGVCACILCADSVDAASFSTTCQACVRYHILREPELSHSDLENAHDAGYRAAEKTFANYRSRIERCPYHGELEYYWLLGWHLYVYLENLNARGKGRAATA